MFVVKAVQDKALQEALCCSLGVEYYPYSLAYMAADLKDDNETVDKYIGLCQFVMQGDGEILTYSCYEDRYEDEAVIVMLRAVMSFMERCGVKNCMFAEGAACERLLNASGFICINGVYSIDLEKFYNTKCNH